MKKNGIKNFIFSFAISLLAVLAVNKAIFYAPKNNSTEQKAIKTKSISLFSKQNFETQNEKELSNLDNIEKLVAKVNNNTESVDESIPEINIQPKAKEIALNTQNNTGIIYSPENETKKAISNKKTTIDHSNHINLASAEEIILEKESIPNDDKTTTKSQILSNMQVVYADISDTIEDESALNNKVENSKEANSILISSNDTIVTENSIEDIIPITTNEEILHDNINVLSSAESTQIAMLEPTTLVSSIDSIEKEEEKNISEVNLKQETITSSNWKQMSEIEEDSPWVVAKGNRFAKNKIAQIDALAEEEVEKEKEKEKSSITENTETQQDEQNGENKPIDSNEDEQASVNESVHQTNSSESDEKKENIITTYDENKEPKAQYTYILPKPIFSYYTINQTISNTSSTQLAEDKTEKTDKEEKNISDEKSKDKISESILDPKPLLIPSSGKKTKLAYNPIPNLIIPLPDDIASDADITPQLSSEPKQKSDKDTKGELNKEEKESGLFKSISSWFSSDDKDEDKEDAENNKNAKNSKKTRKKKRTSFSLFENKSEPALEYEEPEIQDVEIMPAELKLSFQPNRAEISGHTLRWIHAFADNARDNLGIYIEIRIDGTSSFALQQKRLNLLSSIFANRGVDFRKVNIVFTSREPNSFIIRNIKYNNSDEIIVNKDNNGGLYQHW